MARFQCICAWYALTICSITAIVLVHFVAQHAPAKTSELRHDNVLLAGSAKRTTDNELIDRVLKVQRPYQTNLDSTTLGKSQPVSRYCSCNGCRGYAFAKILGGNTEFVRSEAGLGAPGRKLALKLPPGWESGKDFKGKVYFYNAATGVSQWEIPREQPEAQAEKKAETPGDMPNPMQMILGKPKKQVARIEPDARTEKSDEEEESDDPDNRFPHTIGQTKLAKIERKDKLVHQKAREEPEDPNAPWGGVPTSFPIIEPEAIKHKITKYSLKSEIQKVKYRDPALYNDNYDDEDLIGVTKGDDFSDSKPSANIWKIMDEPDTALNEPQDEAQESLDDHELEKLHPQLRYAKTQSMKAAQRKKEAAEKKQAKAAEPQKVANGWETITYGGKKFHYNRATGAWAQPQGNGGGGLPPGGYPGPGKLSGHVSYGSGSSGGGGGYPGPGLPSGDVPYGSGCSGGGGCSGPGLPSGQPPPGLPSGHIQPPGLPSGHIQPPRLPPGHLQPPGLPSGHLQPPPGLPSGHLQRPGLPSGHSQPPGLPLGHLQPPGLPSGHLQPPPGLLSSHPPYPALPQGHLRPPSGLPSGDLQSRPGLQSGHLQRPQGLPPPRGLPPPSGLPSDSVRPAQSNEDTKERYEKKIKERRKEEDPMAPHVWAKKEGMFIPKVCNDKLNRIRDLGTDSSFVGHQGYPSVDQVIRINAEFDARKRIGKRPGEPDSDEEAYKEFEKRSVTTAAPTTSDEPTFRSNFDEFWGSWGDFVPDAPTSLTLGDGSPGSNYGKFANKKSMIK